MSRLLGNHVGRNELREVGDKVNEVSQGPEIGTVAP